MIEIVEFLKIEGREPVGNLERATGERELEKRVAEIAAAAPLFAALPINAIEDLTARIAVRKVAVGSAVVAQDEPGEQPAAARVTNFPRGRSSSPARPK